MTLAKCKICKLPVEPRSGIKAKSSDEWVHRECLDLRRESLCQERRAAAQIKTATLRASLPQSRDEDDQSMLMSAPDKLRRWHSGWSRECNLSALVLAVSGSCKTLTLASKFRVLIGDAVARYADGDDAALEWARRMYFVRAFDLAAADHEHKFGEGKCPEIRRARDASLLFLDDLGNENPGNENLLLNVIDHRISANLPTWVTSGFGIDELTQRYGQALVRRLCEKGSGTLIDLFRAGAQLKAVR